MSVAYDSLHPTLDRLQAPASRVRWRVAGLNPALFAVRFARRFSDVRASGLAAEMTYYLTLSLLPLVTALGAGLGVLEGIVGPETVESMRRGVTAAVRAVLGPRLAAEVVVPLLDQLLREERNGWALAGVVVALLLGSRVFRSALAALGEAVEVPERRRFWRMWGLALALTAGAVVVVTAIVGLLVVGPLLGAGQRLAEAFGAGSFYARAWSVGRWPVAVAVALVFLTVLYRLGQRGTSTWRGLLPGAVLATGGLVGLASGFRLYLAIAAPTSPQVAGASDAVEAVSLFIGTALAVMLLSWLGSIVVLSGGILNAEWAASRRAAALR